MPYWRDVGTVDAYWEANMELTKVTPELNLYDEDWPIWTYQEQLPPAKFVFDDEDRRGMAIDSLVSGGCIISGATVRRSLLFSNVHVHSYCQHRGLGDPARGRIGRRARARSSACVVDKAADPGGHRRSASIREEDRQRFHVTESGITLVTPEMLGQEVHHVTLSAR